MTEQLSGEWDIHLDSLIKTINNWIRERILLSGICTIALYYFLSFLIFQWRLVNCIPK